MRSRIDAVRARASAQAAPAPYVVGDEPTDVDLSGRHVVVLNWRDVGHPEAGGSEVYVDQVAHGLVDRGARVTMLSPRYRGSRRRETIDGVRHVRVGGRLSIYVLAPLLLRSCLLGRADAVVELQNGVPFLATAWAGRPVVVLVHHVHREQWPIVFGPRAARVGWWLESRLAPRVARRSRYVTVSEATRAELALQGIDPQRVAVVHNGSPERGDLTEAARTEHPSLVVLGRLVPHKQVEVALRTLAALRPEVPGLTLTVVGEGWWHHQLEQLADELGVTDAVTFTGHVSDAEKHWHLDRAWVALLPSVKEGWGLAIVEAGLHRTPTIAFAHAGGVAESIVDNETGLLASDELDFTRLTRALLLEDGLRERLGIGAEKHARSFTWPATRGRFARVVADVLS